MEFDHSSIEVKSYTYHKDVSSVTKIKGVKGTKSHELIPFPHARSTHNAPPTALSCTVVFL